MNTPKAPGYPTAAQIQPLADLQTKSSVQTAAAQSQLNDVNQVTPYGNLTYTQNGWSIPGTIAFKNNAGQTASAVETNAARIAQLKKMGYTAGAVTRAPNSVPRMTATMSLSPAEQSLLTGQQKVQAALNQTAQGEAAGLSAPGGALSKPFDLSSASIGSDIAAMYNPRLDTQWSQNYNTLQADLANRGIREGSQAYDHAMTNFQQGKNDAYNQVMIGARDQAVNEMTQQRDQPLNEIAALQSGSAVQQPQQVQTPQTGIPGTNVLGAAQGIYGAANNQYQAQLQQQNSMLGGLTSLGSSLLGGWAMSSRKTKENIKKVGTLDNGLNVYSFRYKPEFGGGLQRLGLMADEVKHKMPDAVAEVLPGVEGVNYATVADRVAA